MYDVTHVLYNYKNSFCFHPLLAWNEDNAEYHELIYADGWYNNSNDGGKIMHETDTVGAGVDDRVQSVG